MFSASKSAVRQIFRYSIFKNVNLIRKMSSFEVEKQKFLSMEISQKRDLYENYIKWEDVPTWKKYASEKSLPSKINILADHSINSAKNKNLAEKIGVFCDDITTLEVDAIVNAANSTLRGGGGVDGAIHKAAGPNLKEECKTLGDCPTGEARLTGGYKLPAKYVIHTVGPKGEKPSDLKNCYTNCLNIMLKNNLKTIAFPCISTGVFGYPNDSAAYVSVYTVRKFLEANADKVDRIIFCLFLEVDVKIYEGLLQSYFPLE